LKLDKLEKAELKKGEGVKEVFAEVSKDRTAAARKALALLEAPGATPEALMKEGRRLIFTKGNDSHDYKFSSAALEDFYHVTPAWRNRYLASSLFNLRGSGARDNGLLERTRSALGQS